VPEIDSSRIAAEHVIAGHPMPYQNVDHLIDSIAAMPSSFETQWEEEVRSFWVESDAEELNDLQRDGATAVIDLAGEFEAGRAAEDRELVARVIGRMSDIQVRDFALEAIPPRPPISIGRCGENFLWRHLADLLHLLHRSSQPWPTNAEKVRWHRRPLIERWPMMRNTL
jgi:hypothetical protein